MIRSRAVSLSKFRMFFFLDELGKLSEMTQDRGDNNILRQKRMDAHLLRCSLGERLDNFRRPWKRVKRLMEVMSGHTDDMYFSHEWSRSNGFVSFHYRDRSASSSSSRLDDDICLPVIRDRPVSH